MATPRIIQWSADAIVGRNMEMTKLVEWPVVESTPLLSVVLYTGHTYHLRSIRSDFRIGINQICQKIKKIVL